MTAAGDDQAIAPAEVAEPTDGDGLDAIAAQFGKTREEVEFILANVNLRQSTDFRQQDNNHNAGTDRGAQALNSSVAENKATRGIFVAADGSIVGGNHAHKELTEQGVVSRWIEVQSNGDIGVATKRTDWESANTAEALKAAIADNRSAILNFAWDEEAFEENIEIIESGGLQLSPAIMTQGEVDDILGMATELSPEDDPTEDSDEIPITVQKGQSSSGSSSEYLKFGSHSVQLTEEELNMLNVRLEAYSEENGSHFGFVRSLLNG